MSNYSAAAVKTGDNTNVDRIITELELLPTQHGRVTQGSTSTTSTLFNNLISTTANGILADDLIRVVAFCTFGLQNGSSAAIEAAIFINSSQADIGLIEYGTAADTGGLRQSMCLAARGENMSGNIPIDLRWRLADGSGSVYSARSTILFYVGKKKA